MKVAPLVVIGLFLLGCKPASVSKPKAKDVPQSPTTVSVRWGNSGDMDSRPGQFVAGAALSNGRLGFGVDGIYPAIDEGSGSQSLWLANWFSETGVRSLLRFTNPLSIDYSSYELPPEALVSLDTTTGIYEVAWPSKGAHARYQIVMSPDSATFSERLMVRGTMPAGLSLKNPGTPFTVTPSQLGDDKVSDLHTSQYNRVSEEGEERWHGFGRKLAEESFDSVARRAKDWVSGPTAPRITIDGPIDDQLAVNSMLFHLRSGVNPDGPTGPFGLTNPKYGGRAFWDADTWMFPALALLDPERASSIPRFRLATRTAATELAYQWAKDTRSQFEPSVRPYKFPWEAGPDGRENAIGDSRHQEHITADVARCLLQASALGLVSDSEATATVKGCAQYLWHRATRLSNGDWGILSTMSPDEFHTGDNDLYTNIGAEQVLKAGFPDRWMSWSFKRPKDATTYLTYDNDGLRGYKQAAALLAIWPLQDAGCEKDALAMLKRFAGKATKSGPAMSTSVEALVTARFGSAEDAYRLWRDSWQRYTKRPLMMFSESPNGRNAYFLTGAAGCLDALIYGLIGLRIDDHDPGQRPWKLSLRNGHWLSCSPNLPQAWGSVNVDNLTVLGQRYRLKATGRTVTVSLMR